MKKYFTTKDLAAIILFCPLYALLNLYFGPIGFALLQLPIFCDISVFLPLLLATWLTNKFGSTSLVGVIGSLIVLSARPGSTQMLGFAVAAILFDVFMTVNRHKISLNTYSIVTTTIMTAVSAYLAGVIIGAIIMGRSLYWALTFWGPWHLVGGIMGLAIAFPVIGALEKANVKGIKGA